LSDLAEIFGDKYISVAREMTKKFEEIRESAVTEAIEHFKKTQPKGEFVLIIDNHQ
jgi:16S rRNA (cytidine1402-2'-O)-methyltransferase